MRVLVGVDGSSNSLATVTFVGRLLSVDHDELVLAYVVPELPYLGDDQLDPGVAKRAATALSAAVFDEAVLRLPEVWQTRAQKAELSGSPGPSLLAAVAEKKIDLVAVGFRGTGFFERIMLGSVSRAVVQSAEVPVLVVKTTGGPDSEKIAGTPDGTFRVLVPYDGSEFGEKIAAMMNNAGWPDGARGWVLTVVPPMFVHQLPKWMQPIQRNPDVQAMAEAWQKEYDQQLEHAVDKLKAYQDKLPPLFQSTEPIVAQGHPAEQILATVARLKIDLTVIGSRGHGTVERLLVGSTSARVVNEATCSVLIAR